MPYHKKQCLRSLIRVITSNWISCLLWFGTDEAGIQKIRLSDNFLKEAKTAAFQLRSPPAEAKPTYLKERRNFKEEKNVKIKEGLMRILVKELIPGRIVILERGQYFI